MTKVTRVSLYLTILLSFFAFIWPIVAICIGTLLNFWWSCYIIRGAALVDTCATLQANIVLSFLIQGYFIVKSVWLIGIPAAASLLVTVAFIVRDRHRSI